MNLLSKAKDLLLSHIAENLSPKSVKFLKANGDTVITKIRVEKKPLDKGVNTLLNTISLGTFQKAKKDLDYDEMFHLYMVINDKFVIEKNELLNMGTYTTDANSQSMDVPNIPDGLTINQLVEKGQKAMGADFQKYDAFSTNCQDFIKRVLDANGLLTPSLKDFIMQDAVGVLKGLPSYMSSTSKTLTDIGAIGRFLKEKAGFKKGGTIFLNSNRRQKRRLI